MSILLPLLAVQAIVGGQGHDSAGDLSSFYNPRREVSFSGTVTGKTKGRAPGYAEGMSILVRTGKTVREVELGPTWYVGRQQATINLGDKVKVTGVPLVLDGREKVTVARQIMRGHQILALRDNSGMPYWDPRRSSSGMVTSNMGSRYQGRINRANTYTINGEQYSGYVVDTDNGPLDVAVAPSWYWNNQPTIFTPGTNVTLYGNGPVTRVGSTNGYGGVLLLNSATYDGGTIILNNGASSYYGGFRTLP